MTEKYCNYKYDMKAIIKAHTPYPKLQINVSYYECYQNHIKYQFIIFLFSNLSFFVFICFVDEQYQMFHRGYQRGQSWAKDDEDHLCQPFTFASLAVCDQHLFLWKDLPSFFKKIRFLAPVSCNSFCSTSVYFLKWH